MAIKINGQVIQLVQNVEGTDADTIIEIDNSDGLSTTPEFRLTDVTQTDPAGRFRVKVSADTIQIQAATKELWEEFRTLVTFNRDGQTAIALTEAGIIDLLERIQLSVEQGGEIGVRWNQLVELGLLSG